MITANIRIFEHPKDRQYWTKHPPSAFTYIVQSSCSYSKQRNIKNYCDNKSQYRCIFKKGTTTRIDKYYHYKEGEILRTSGSSFEVRVLFRKAVKDCITKVKHPHPIDWGVTLLLVADRASTIRTSICFV